MMLKRVAISLAVIFLAIAMTAQNVRVKKIWKDAEQQVSLLYKNVLKNRVNQQLFPRTLTGDSLRLVASGDWTSGFWPGLLWLLYEYSGNPDWKSKAGEFTVLMEKETQNRSSHDAGFKINNSYGHARRLTGDTAYKKQIIRAAAALRSRFNKTTGCIRSWDFVKWQYPVIIDNMMNLELLFVATRLSNDSSYYKIAVAHANTTMKNHFRSDFSSYHVVDYDTMTGKIISKTTHQGYADESAWARGQAWALYGYTMCYRETKDTNYLNQADRVAAFILNHPNLPPDKIPYWDFNAPVINAPRDASAAAIIASALYELKNYSKNRKRYRVVADSIVKNLTENYRTLPGTHAGFILLHSTGNKPANGEVDVPLIYADYYFLEALIRRQKGNLIIETTINQGQSGLSL